jgi:Domain of unknown function (DUF1918)
MGRGRPVVAGPYREVIAMRAVVGDRVFINAARVNGPVRDGEVVEVRGADGAPPYLVRWSDGHEGLYFPGPDASVRHDAG